MRRAEQVTCIVWLVLAGSLCGGALQLKVGTPSEPGSGFLPLATGFLLGILALVHLFQITLRKFEKEKAETFLGKVNWQRGFFVVASLFLYALLLPRLGYIITTFLLMLVLFSLYERKKWWVVCGLTLIVIAVTFLVFHHWLKVQFPSGFFRIG